MRIGLITGEYPPMRGGIADYTEHLARALHADGHTVHIASEDRARTQSAQIPVFSVGTHWRLAALRNIRIWAQSNQFDVLNLQYQTAAYRMSPWIHFLPQFVSQPLVTTFHDLRFPYLFPKAGPLRTWIVRYLAKHSAGAIVTNPEDHATLATVVTHLREIPIGSAIPKVENPNPQIWRDHFAIPDEAFLLGFFGMLNHSKGIELLLEALTRLREQGERIHLLLMGELIGASDPTNRAYAERIRTLIQEYSLTDVIHITGYLDASAVSEAMQGVDLMVLPFRDGASMRRSSLTAALANHCAILSTQSPDHSPLFESGALDLIPMFRAHTLSEAIINLRDHPAKRQELQQAASAFAQRFTWPHIARETIEFFAEVQAASSRSRP